MYKLEEPQVEREFLLGNAPMRTQPTAQERPEPFHRIHMHFTQAVAIVVSCELTPSMVDMLMTVAPGLQTGINAVLISINKCAGINSVSLLLALQEGTCDKRQ